jgi:predicted enzyme related to lactoylglutathione lyase
MKCSCCGEDRDPESVATLRCASDVGVCRARLGWLLGQAGGVDVTPILPVRDLDEGVRFYESAGFDARAYDGGFAFVALHDDGAFDLDLVEGLDPENNAAGCYIVVDRVDEWHAELVAAGLAVTSPEDQPWGMREFTLTDPSGNRVRIGRGI